MNPSCLRSAIPASLRPHALLLAVALVALPAFAGAEPPRGGHLSPIPARPGPVAGVSIPLAGTATVNFSDLARQEALGGGVRPPVRPRFLRELEEPLEAPGPIAPEVIVPPLVTPLGASPSPSSSFMGLDDIPMVDSSYIIIPPDVGGAVGPTRVMSVYNNNYRVFDKATGAVLSTVGPATFWAASGETDLGSLTDPRTIYDPYNNRWIVEMQTFSSSGDILIGVSQTSDPGGSWYLYRFNTGVSIDFPELGFNRNWITVAINRYSAGGTFQRGITLVADYAQARAGTLASATTFTQAANSHFCSAPCATYSTISDTLYVVTHLSSSGGTYTLDWITGTSTPAYVVGGATLTRTGGGWAQPSGNLLPQSAPSSGTSVCGATPCPIETQDAQIRSAPVYRGGSIYYAQTVGLPASGLTHTAVQWTKITTAGSPPSGSTVDGGRIEDPTATASNGGKWYAYPHIAVNGGGDFLVGYSQFSSAQHPSAGYSVHLAADAAGTTRDPAIYKPGDDYYHKTFTTTTGRNRWGDFTTAQVDPSDDLSLWTVQEYGKARPGTDDGNTGSNSSRWSTYWAKVITGVTFTITASAGANGSISPSGAVVVAQGASQTFAISPGIGFHVADVLVDAASVGPVTSYTFSNVQANHTISASFAINSYTITASAGANGSITPSGAIAVTFGGSQSFAIAANGGYHVADVLVDAASVGAVTSYTFSNVQADHTIAASFAVNPAVAPIADLSAAVVAAGNGAGDTTQIALGWTAVPTGSQVAVYRAGFGNYPEYDDAPGAGAAPAVPSYPPPAPWALTAVTAPGQTDNPAARDSWYYVAFVRDAYGTVSAASNLAGGVLNYVLGDVTDGTTAGRGDNQVNTADVSLLGAFYGLTGPAMAGCSYLDVGPTSDGTVLGRPLTDDRIDFEDLAIFALNYGANRSAAKAPPLAAAGGTQLLVDAPLQVSAGERVTVRLSLRGAGDVQALSAKLKWDPAVVQPESWTAGELVGRLGAVALSSQPGDVDVARLGSAGGGLAGEGELATVSFRALASGDPGIGLASLVARDAANAAVTVARADAAGTLPAATSLAGAIPSPFHRATTIRFALAHPGPATVAIYGVDGRRVRTLVDGSRDAGEYRIEWDGRGDSGVQLRAGVYFVRLEAGETRLSRSIVYLR